MSARFMLVVLVASLVAIWALVLGIDEHGSEWSLRLLGYSVAGLSTGLLGFERFAWRWVPFSWVLRRPDLRGTWYGTLVADPEGAASRHEVFLVVHQTFATLRTRLMTQESQSHTIAASMVMDADGRLSVFYVYRNDPRLEHQGRSRSHRGAVQLWVGGDGKGLGGEYWTDRKSTGSLELRLVSRRRAGSWEEAVGLVEGGRRVREGRTRDGLVGAARREPVPAELVDALAEVVSESEKARMVALRAGFPAAHLPEFKSAAQFWSAVLREAAQGRMPVRALIEEVARQFPHNEELRAHADRLAS